MLHRPFADIKTKFLNFQSQTKQGRRKYVKPHLSRKYLSNNDEKTILDHCSIHPILISILMSALLLLRYYGSCYRLQHVEKLTHKHRGGHDMSKSRYVKFQERNMPKKQRNEKEDRSRGRGQNCTLPG